MKAELQRIAIGTACGFTRIRTIGMVGGGERYVCQLGPVERDLPGYLNDLNAMREAWASLPWDRQMAFSFGLHEVCGSNQLNHVVNATAAQRAEAFLKTLNLWTT